MIVVNAMNAVTMTSKPRELIVEAVGHFIDGELHEIER